MNYGFYLSAAGALTSIHRQDVIANNLANSQTVGFKPDQVFIKQRLPARFESGAGIEDAQLLLERLGGGQFVVPTYTNMKQGELNPTGRKLDLAIGGEGFFVLNSGRGEGAEHLRFTRDGRFAISGTGELVLASSGMQVLNELDAHIKLDPGAEIRIEPTGEIFQDDALVGKIQVTALPDQRQLRKMGSNLFALTNTAQTNRSPAAVTLHQGFTEASAVDPVMALNALISASKAAQGNAKLMQYHDHIMDQAINTLGRVA